MHHDDDGGLGSVVVVDVVVAVLKELAYGA